MQEVLRSVKSERGDWAQSFQRLESEAGSSALVDVGAYRGERSTLVEPRFESLAAKLERRASSLRQFRDQFQTASAELKQLESDAAALKQQTDELDAPGTELEAKQLLLSVRSASCARKSYILYQCTVYIRVCIGCRKIVLANAQCAVDCGGYSHSYRTWRRSWPHSARGTRRSRRGCTRR